MSIGMRGPPIPVHHRGGAVKAACHEWSQGTAGSVGKSSGINRLTEMPTLWRVCLRRRRHPLLVLSRGAFGSEVRILR
jgi:hypothetical protein